MKAEECDKKRWGDVVRFCPQYRLLKWKRYCEKFYNNRLLYCLVWAVYHESKVKYGANIPAKTKIGPGFKIEHLNGIVINPDVIIGKISTFIMV